ncbi:MAG TPA: hypothetical protein VGP08_16240 [Pyrinomonadaceae bacterium]|nr:hypothetical protein [Pyrinomonadaceae bacterium]
MARGRVPFCASQTLPTRGRAGWKFWLGKLDDNGGDFVRTEMVKAFISSDEYRHRFGQ